MIALASFARPAAPPEPDAPPVPLGLSALTKMAFDGTDLGPLSSSLIRRMVMEPENAAVLMDLATIEQLFGNREDGLRLQLQALELQRLYRRPPALVSERGVRVRAIMAPGDFMANTPLEFLLEGSDVTLDMLYLLPGHPLPKRIPEHDLAFVAIGESDVNLPLLREAEAFVKSRRRPVLNAPERIARLSRDGAWSLLKDAPGIAIPHTRRVERMRLAALAQGDGAGDAPSYPLIVRPIGSHAGEGLERIDGAEALAAYLGEHREAEFFVAPFVDYRGADGLYRKYRIALIDGRPYASHMGVSEHWMIHYLNAGMRESAKKRAEEARWMAGFDENFTRRHAPAFQALAERVGLDYFGIDCGETPDGDLLIFEIDVAMIVHSMDPPEIFPYKQPQMQKVFAAFRDLLERKRAAA